LKETGYSFSLSTKWFQNWKGTNAIEPHDRIDHNSSAVVHNEITIAKGSRIARVAFLSR
jgi:hypothetical protein